MRASPSWPNYLSKGPPSHTITSWIIVVIQLLSRVWLFAAPWTAAHQVSLSITDSWSLLKLMSSSWWCHPTISSSVILFCSCLQSFPVSWSFPISQLFASGGHSIKASASVSVLLKNIKGWFTLGLTAFISLQSKGLDIHSKGLSRVLSGTTIRKH